MLWTRSALRSASFPSLHKTVGALIPLQTLAVGVTDLPPAQTMRSFYFSSGQLAPVTPMTEPSAVGVTDFLPEQKMRSFYFSSGQLAPVTQMTQPFTESVINSDSTSSRANSSFPKAYLDSNSVKENFGCFTMWFPWRKARRCGVRV